MGGSCKELAWICGRRHIRLAPKTISHSFGFRAGVGVDKLGQLADELEAEAFADRFLVGVTFSFTRTTPVVHEAPSSVRSLRRPLRGGDVAHEGNQQGGDDEGDHDGAKGVGVGHGRRLAIGEAPELLERGGMPMLRAGIAA